MNVETGEIYENKQKALDAGVPEDKIVEGSYESIRKLSHLIKKENKEERARRLLNRKIAFRNRMKVVRKNNRKKDKIQKASRKKNR